MSTTTIILCKIVFVLFSGLLSGYSYSQCTATSALSGSSFTTQSLSGSSYNWNNSGNLSSSDDNRTTAAAVIGVLSGTTNYVKATGFGFAIPSGSGICGVKVEIEKSGANLGLFSSIQDYDIRLVKNGTITGSNYATNTDWGNTDNYYVYGGASDKWGTTWSVADINSGNFGIVIAAQLGGIISLLPVARIDNVRITVYFNIVLPVNVSSFSATTTNTSVLLKWQAPETADDKIFTVQKSTDGNKWETVQGSIIYNQWLNQYELTDTKPYTFSYYRIKTETKDGSISYSDIRKTQLLVGNEISTYPNPSSKTIQIKVSEKLLIKIYNQAGQMVLTTQLLPTTNVIDISGLKPGLYFFKSDDSKKIGRFQKTGN